MSLIGFDSRSVDTSDKYADLPRAWYRCIIDEVEEKENSKGTGRMLVITFQILNGPFEGRKIWHNINYEHNNSEAQEIGQRQLGQLMEACEIGVLKTANGSDFADKVLDVRASQKEDNTKVVGVRMPPEKAKSPPVTATPKVQQSAQATFDDDIPF